MDRKDQDGVEVGGEILLESGSVYIQSEALRYEYEHSVLSGGPRVSIMVRVKQCRSFDRTFNDRHLQDRLP